MTLTEGVTLQVDDVYVPLGLVERKKQSKHKDNTSLEQGTDKIQDDVSPEQGSELYKETEITKNFEHDAFLEEVLKQKNTPKSQGKRIAIIGEPGAGKTTLLQQIADWVSREIQQSIVIWVSLADLREKELKAYLFETWLNQVAEKIGKAEATKQLKDDFVALFNQNNVWLLLDGLDEMSASSGNSLTEISRQLREAGAISQSRIVLTCRVNMWDGSINALDDFDTYRTLDFSYPKDVEKFIDKWFNKIEIPQAGKQLCIALKEPGKERIQDLVKNPLRLTLLCLNWQSGDGKLPDTQSGLYQQFVDDFYKWKKDKVAITPAQIQQLNIQLGELAKTAIDQETTRFRLQQDFVNRFLGDAEDKNSLLSLALNRGWLNSIGIDTHRKPVYAFFHASFQEYFAAKAIDDWNFFLPRKHKNKPVKFKDAKYRVFEPQWKQTILLWLGREEETFKQQKQQFIDTLISFKDGCQKFYEYRAYLLAATGIAEFKDYVRADEIIAQIVNWIIDSHSSLKEEARSALQQTDRTKAIAALVQLLQSQNLSDYTIGQVVESLETIGTGNEVAIAALVQLLQSQNLDYSIRRRAAESLGNIDPGNEFAIASLVQLLQSQNLDEDTIRQATYSINKIGTGNEDAIAALVQLLQSQNLSDYTIREAAEQLGEIDPGNEDAIAALVQLLQSQHLSDYSIGQAAYSLGQIGTGNEFAIAALVQLLQSQHLSDYTRWLARYSIEKIGTGNEFAIAALVQLLQSQHLSDYTRWLARYSIEKIGTGNEFAIAALVQLLQSQHLSDYTRWLARYSIEKIGTGNEFAIAALVQLLQSQHLSDYTRRLVASSLGTIDPGNEDAIATLVQLLQSPNLDDYTRRLAASSLGTIDPGNKFAIAAFVQLLQSPNLDDSTRRLVASSLGTIDPGNEFAIAALVQLLQSQHLDEDTIRQAAYSLGNIDPGNQVAITALVQLLQSPNLDEDTIRQAAESLGNIGTGNEDVIAALVQLLQSQHLDNSTRWQAGLSLINIGTGNEDVIATLVQLLQSHNLDNSTRWLAAESLGKIDPGNEFVIAASVQLLQSHNLDNSTRREAASSLGRIIRDNKHRFTAVKALSSYWRLDDNFYNLAWECAKNMPYPDFYQAWHQHNFATRTMRSIMKILLTEI
ncbi:HEAT repeat domain-containing protein [Tolypothrix sp. LEGE 11397]|nr:HEAT repeat domain-containing protein [Tolypothrix sp. LEGE 11397]